MSENTTALPLRLDPWAASSLLQKAIRRGESALAQEAARLLYEYRGPAIWPRLVTIAVEDIGIADLELVTEVARLGTDKMLRAMLGSDTELLHDLCSKLAAAPKDRSADYLHSAAVCRVSGVATDRVEEARGRAPTEPIVSAARRLLVECTALSGPKLVIRQAALERVLESREYSPCALLEDAILRLAKSRIHPFTLMLLPLWSAFVTSNKEAHISPQTLPDAEWVRGVPLFIFDKHTAVGKSAIAQFAHENLEARRTLKRSVEPRKQLDVALMAAFYADAVPVARKLQWLYCDALEDRGCRADMVMAGCPVASIEPILACVRENLEDLNDCRRRLVWRP